MEDPEQEGLLSGRHHEQKSLLGWEDHKQGGLLDGGHQGQ